MAHAREIERWNFERSKIMDRSAPPPRPQTPEAQINNPVTNFVNTQQAELSKLNNVASFVFSSVELERRQMAIENIPPDKHPQRMNARALRFYNRTIRNGDGETPESIRKQIIELNAKLPTFVIPVYEQASVKAFIDTLMRLQVHTKLSIWQRIKNNFKSKNPTEDEATTKTALDKIVSELTVDTNQLKDKITE